MNVLANSSSPQEISVARYTNISAIDLDVDDSGVWTTLEANSSMSLSITINIYRGSSLVKTFKTGKTGFVLHLDESYNFTSGYTYTIEGTYKAGSETVTKSLTYRP